MKDPAKKPPAEEKLDEEIEELFPASDPPANTTDLRRRPGAAADKGAAKGKPGRTRS